MSGALDSGMDMVIEIAHDYILRIIRRRVSELDRGCFEVENVPIPNPGLPIPDDEIPVDIVKAGLFVDDISFEQTLHGPVFVSLDLRLFYAQVTSPVSGTLDELEDEYHLDEGSLHTFNTGPLPLSATADGDRVILGIDTSLLDFLPQELRDLLGDEISLPINFLNQTQSYTDDAGDQQMITLLAVTINGAPEIKEVGVDNLAIGLDLQLTQDEPMMILGPSVRQDVDPVMANLEDLIPHGCGLPEEPAVDRLAFQSEFNESFRNGNDWAIALDAHVIDAMLRGLPSAGMNDEGEETDSCEHKDALRSMCIRLDELRRDLILIRGSGLAYVCPPDWAFTDNGYFRIEFGATITLHRDGRRMRAEYVVTDFDVPLLPGNLEDYALALAGEEPNTEGELDFEFLDTRFGETTDAAGRFTIEELQIRFDGAVLRGSSNVQPGQRTLHAPDELLFETGCQPDGSPSRRRFWIHNRGNADIHLCPLNIRKHPNGNENDVDLFTVTSPDELLDNGEGLALRPNESVRVAVECSGNPDGVYLAILDIPNDAREKTITLDANFLPAALGPVEEVDIGNVEYDWSGCDRPPDRSAVYDLEITNEGPGHMRICSVVFSEELRDVFSASVPGVFAAGTATITVEFFAIWGENRVYDGTMSIMTNSSEVRQIPVRAQVTTHEGDPFGLLARPKFDFEFFCGHADWDQIQDAGGPILDVHEVAELLPILGGDECCPFRGPTCLCVDLWQTSFDDVPYGVRLEVVESSGVPIATNFAESFARTLITPFKEENRYALRADLAELDMAGKGSKVTMVRWLAQQDSLYMSGQRLNDLAVFGEHVYAAGSHDMEVISLVNLDQPEKVALVDGVANVTSLAVLGQNLLAGEYGLNVFSLANPRKPIVIGRLALSSEIKDIVPCKTTNMAVPLVYGLGSRMHVFDLTDLKQPTELMSIKTRVRANRGIQHGRFLYLFGDNGIEVFDLSKPDSPQIIGYLPTEREIKNALISGSHAMIAYDIRSADLVDLAEPSQPQLAGSWRLEKWVAEYVPLAGNVPHHRSNFLVLRADQAGFRVMRIRPNKVDQQKLQQWQSKRSR